MEGRAVFSAVTCSFPAGGELSLESRKCAGAFPTEIIRRAHGAGNQPPPPVIFRGDEVTTFQDANRAATFRKLEQAPSPYSLVSSRLGFPEIACPVLAIFPFSRERIAGNEKKIKSGK